MPASMMPNPDLILQAVRDNIAGVHVVRPQTVSVEVLAAYLNLENTAELFKLVDSPQVQRWLIMVKQEAKVCPCFVHFNRILCSVTDLCVTTTVYCENSAWYANHRCQYILPSP